MLRCYCKTTFEELEACEYLKPVVEILEHNEFAAGPELTLVDFQLLELCEYGQYLSQGELYQENKIVEKYVIKMKEYPSIKSYIESGRLDGLKFNNKNAKI